MLAGATTGGAIDLEVMHMKLEKLLDLVGESYPDRDSFDRARIEAERRDIPGREIGEVGDTLALFVVFEIADRFNEDATDAEQIGDAHEAMQSAIDDLMVVHEALDRALREVEA